MIGKAILFCLITFGLTMVISLFVACIIKLIAVILRRQEAASEAKKTAGNAR